MNCLTFGIQHANIKCKHSKYLTEKLVNRRKSYLTYDATFTSTTTESAAEYSSHLVKDYLTFPKIILNLQVEQNHVDNDPVDTSKAKH